MPVGTAGPQPTRRDGVRAADYLSVTLTTPLVSRQLQLGRRAASIFVPCFVVAALCLSSVASAQDPKRQLPADPSRPAQPLLARFAAERVVVFPAQLLSSDTGAFVAAKTWGGFRKELDDSIGSAISERGIGKGWWYAADVVRAARRNAPYTGDPYSMGAQALRSALIRPGDMLPALLAGNIRTLIAIGNARYALLPIELRFERQGALQRAVLRLAMIDGRRAQFIWVGEVAGEAGASLTPAIVRSLAERVADLVTAQ